MERKEKETQMRSEVSCRLDAAPKISYARMQNGVPAVSGIVVRNTACTGYDGLGVRITADPQFAHICTIPLGNIAPKGRLVSNASELKLSADFLANLTEPVKAVLRAEVTVPAPLSAPSADLSGGAGPDGSGTASGDGVLCCTSADVELLPYDEWEGLHDMPELLAAFVLPNHPSIKAVLPTASEQLKALTGDGSLDEYQSGRPERVASQMEAVYNALKSKQISYSSVPASFHETGQRVRLPEEIFKTLTANCLDVSLLYAACLEAVGLRPVIVLVEGHAFAGCWIERDSSPYAVNDDHARLDNLCAKGIRKILLVETTAFLRDRETSFGDSVNIAHSTLEDSGRFLCFIDIAAARKMGVRPLPLRVATPAGYVIREEKVRAVRDADVAVGDRDSVDLDARGKVDKHIIWERRLLDLTLRNSLLNVHTHSSCIQLMCPDPVAICNNIETQRPFVISGTPEPLWTGMLLRKGIVSPMGCADPAWNYSMGELDDFRFHSYLDDTGTFERCAAIRRAARSSIEESGANTLYISVGSLRWFDEDGRGPYSAPVVLYPAELSLFGYSHTVSVTEDEPMVNMTLLEMLRQRFSINVPGLETLPQRDGRVDVRLVLNTIRKAVMDMKGWEVDNLVFLGNFMFNKFIIWNDIHRNRRILDASPLVSSLVDGRLKVADRGGIAEGDDLDARCPSSGILLPIGADSSQLKAIAEAVGGRTFVMHGPPGTGKSQTITNIIANALFRGKRVLFVSEKKAALDVVQSRLEALGLDPFCLELHSNKARKSVVLKKLESTLSIAGTETESKAFLEESQRYDAMRRELDSHAFGLNRVYPAGLSLYDCISRYLALPQTYCRNMPSSIVDGLTDRKIRDMESYLQDYVTSIKHTHIDGSCGLLDMPLDGYSPDMEKTMRAMLEKIRSSRGLARWRALKKFEGRFGIHFRTGLLGGSLGLAYGTCERWIDNLDDARQYAIYSKYRAALRSSGLAYVAEAYEGGNVPADGLMDFFHRSLYRSYAEYILSKEEALNLFCGELFESRLEKFRDLDARISELSRLAVFNAAASRLPVASVEAKSGLEYNILMRAVRNGCRGMSLRTFFSLVPGLLPRICPCVLMSPLSVSQYLRSEGNLFDLVIFDEASQMPTSEAVAAISRGSSVVVVGDPNQLPPTTFFEASNYDEDNAGIEDLDSILDDTLALSLPSTHLKWHYRSRHESLISFSNINYYDNMLLTFPSIDDRRSAVSFVKVDGLYDRGRSRQNAVEAEAVVEDIRQRLSDPSRKGQTIGVVTFSATQQAAIESRLEDMLRRYSMLKKASNELPEPIFVKNLENVQGDERDVILFSVGYGVDSKGKVPMNFGPLNQAGGWRRLNVAVSRARLEMKVFSSILPEQMPVAGLSKGVSDLRAFLQYAAGGRESLEDRVSERHGSDAFVERLAEELRRQGRTVDTFVGSSDFRVDIGVVDPSDPSRYERGIIVDGPGYASAITARDREVTRLSMLGSLGWTIERRWILDRYGKQ